MAACAVCHWSSSPFIFGESSEDAFPGFLWKTELHFCPFLKNSDNLAQRDPAPGAVEMDAITSILE